jgi:hypothetical protein
LAGRTLDAARTTRAARMPWVIIIVLCLMGEQRAKIGWGDGHTGEGGVTELTG